MGYVRITRLKHLTQKKLIKALQTSNTIIYNKPKVQMSFKDILLSLPYDNPQNHELRKFLFFTIKQQQKGYLEGCKMAQRVKALIAKANYWSSNPGSHVVEGENKLLQVGLQLPHLHIMAHAHLSLPMPMHTNK